MDALVMCPDHEGLPLTAVESFSVMLIKVQDIAEVQPDFDFSQDSRLVSL
jgi:hypothetical protein